MNTFFETIYFTTGKPLDKWIRKFHFSSFMLLINFGNISPKSIHAGQSLCIFVESNPLPSPHSTASSVSFKLSAKMRDKVSDLDYGNDWPVWIALELSSEKIKSKSNLAVSSTICSFLSGNGWKLSQLRTGVKSEISCEPMSFNKIMICLSHYQNFIESHLSFKFYQLNNFFQQFLPPLFSFSEFLTSFDWPKSRIS